MTAAQFSSMETLTTLLELGSNPNHLDHQDQPALYHALVSETMPVILKLLNVTNNGLKSCFHALASTKSIGISTEILTFVKEKTQQHNSELFIHSMESAFMFGNVNLLKILLGRNGQNKSIKFWNSGVLKGKLMSSMPTFIENAILSTF